VDYHFVRIAKLRNEFDNEVADYRYYLTKSKKKKEKEILAEYDNYTESYAHKLLDIYHD